MPVDVPLDILIVDDDADTRSNLRDILELDGCCIDEAGSVAETLDRKGWAKYSTILLDRKLPDGTAFDLLPELKRLAPTADVIILTGYGDIDGVIAALRHGAADYLMKPINPRELKSRIFRFAELRRADQELKRRSFILQSVLKQVTDMVLVVDDQGQVLLHSPAVEALLGPTRVGAPPHEWPTLGRMYRADTVTPYTLEELPLHRAMHGERVIDEDVFIRPPDGQPGRWMSDNATPLVGPEGIQGAIAILRDMTERKEAQARAVQAERLIRERTSELIQQIRLIDQARDAILVRSSEGLISSWNQGAERLYGWAKGEALGRTSHQLLKTRLPRPLAEIEGELERVGSWDGELIHESRDGRRIVVASRWVLDHDRSLDTAILEINSDITERKEAQTRAVQAERLAAIGEMMTGLAHESRNALQRAQACLEMLALAVSDRPRAVDLVARMQRAQDDLARLYEDVRNYAAPILLRLMSCLVADVWTVAWEDLEPHRRGREATLRVTFEDEAAVIPLDSYRMGQVFRNLLENALAACADPVEIAIRCVSDQLNGRPALRISVSDNGPGFTPEQRSKAFEAFFTTKSRGTGLGLAICRRIVEAHGGRIDLGGPGPGAEFIIIIPKGQP